MSDLMSANFIMIMGLIGSDEDLCDEKKRFVSSGRQGF